MKPSCRDILVGLVENQGFRGLHGIVGLPCGNMLLLRLESEDLQDTFFEISLALLEHLGLRGVQGLGGLPWSNTFF